MNEQTPPMQPMTRLPWPIMAAAILSLGTLLFTSHGAVPLAYVYIVALLATYFTNARIEDGSPVRWFALIGLIGIAYATARLIEPNGGDYALLPAWMRSFFGLIYGGEMLIRVWRCKPGNSTDPIAVLFLSGLVFLTASNTFEEGYIRVVTPVYILSLLLGLRSYRSLITATRLPTMASHETGNLSRSLRGGAIILALFCGLISFQVFSHFKGDLTEWGNNLAGQHFQDRMETALMAEQPSLGRTFGLRGSPMRILRISGTDGYIGDPHLRGMSFGTYKEGRWSPAVNERDFVTPDAERDLRLATGLNAPLIGITSVVQVTRLVRGNPLIYAPLNVSEVDLSDAERVQWAPETGGPIRTPAPPPFTYTLSIPANDRIQGILARRLTGETRRRYLQLPDKFDPKVRALARSIVGKATQPRDKIEAIVTYLLTHHQYSLTIDPGPGDPVANFLLSSPPKDAHCEYFAAGAALLLRCVGLPTRYVTGYYVHESDGKNTSVVRQRDAHAWTEVWINNVGWTTVDATPGNGKPDFNPPPIASGQAFWERIQDFFQAVRDWLGDLKPEQINLIVGVLTVTTLIGGGIYLFIRRRRRGQVEHLPGYDPYRGADTRLAALATRFEQAFARRGSPFSENGTWQEHLTTLANDGAEGPFPHIVPLARRFVSLYERARFGALLRETVDALAAMNEMQDLLIQIEASSADADSKRSAKGTSTPAA